MQIGALSGKPVDLVVLAVDVVGVVALAAGHHVVAVAAGQQVVADASGQRVVALKAVDVVVAGLAIQYVVASTAGNVVGERIARAVDARGSIEFQVLDIGIENVGRKYRTKGIEAFARLLLDLVAQVVDDVEVIPHATGHHVFAATAEEPVGSRTAGERILSQRAIQIVVGAVAGDDVVGAVAATFDRGVTGQNQVLDIDGGRRPRGWCFRR